jgi:outer membrane receptor for ferrienterochelin and colicin
MSLSVVFATVAMFFAASVHAQGNVTGHIYGDVQSSAGTGTAAQVTVRNLDTGRTKSEATNADGSFRISGMQVGRYEVTATAPGFDGSSTEVTVNVGEGSGVTLFLAGADETIDEIVTTASAIDNLNMTQSETTTVITTVDMERLPIPRDINAVALLAPGAVYGDTAFGVAKTAQHYGTNYGFASFGGASVGENAYFINGMNVTNFRNGLGGSTVPFEFFDQFQIKTGGYSAEFGRSTGGVVNAVTRRGSNEWEFRVGMNFEPESLRGTGNNVSDPSNPGEYDSVYKFDEKDSTEGFISVGGPIIKDRLFVYGIYNFRDISEDNYTGGGRLLEDRDDDPFWGAKIDWYITENHSLELTGFSDQKEQIRTSYVWDEATNTVGTELGDTIIDRGGDTYIAKYTGNLTDSFTVSVLYGESEYNLTSAAPTDTTCPLAYESRGGGLNQIGCWVNSQPSSGLDERETARIDFEWELGDHFLRFGYDSEDNLSADNTMYSGGEYFRYFDATPGDTLNNGAVVPDGVTELTRYRLFFGGGDFQVKQEALYIEDEWQMTDNLNVRLGLRSETFDNRNAAGDTFIKVTDQIAPRLGLVWDMGGDGSKRLFANYGRYHLPIATNTNIRLSGAELFTEAWHILDAPIAADGSTVLGQELGSANVYGDGTVPDVRSTIDLGIEPMFQDEFILGFETEAFDGYVASISYTHRDLGRGIEDLTIDEAIGSIGEFHYILANPGQPVNTFYDCEPRDPVTGACSGDGVMEEYNFTADELGFPDVQRKYHGVTLGLEREWDGSFYLKGQWTISHSYGNYEGMVRSDNGQDDAGITTLYDFAGLLDGAKGDLPNDRRHVVKVWGVWEPVENLQLSGALSYSSGRPKNSFGLHPTDPFAVLYGAESFFNQGEFTPRGSQGNMPSRTNLDAGLKYTMDMANGMMATFRLDVFNLLDSDTVTETDEVADEETGFPAATYDLPTRFMTPRSVRLGVTFDF